MKDILYLNEYLRWESPRVNLPQKVQVVDLTHRCSRHATEQSNTSSVSMTQRTDCNLYTAVLQI